MLLELAVENIAIIDKSSVSLSDGFTALTGETGAGKSLLVDAITLALGGRADSDLVRTGATKGSVALLVDVSNLPQVLTRCTELGVEVDDGQLAIQRDLNSEGRSTVRLNGRPASVGVLKELGSMLVDLHGQHDHQALLVPERQIEFLDAWIGETLVPLLARVSEQFEEAESTRRKLGNLQRSHREREQRIDMLEYQIQEIESINPLVGESEAIQVQIERLKHSERLFEGSNRAVNQTVEGEGSAIELLGSAVRELEALESFDPTLSGIVENFRDSLLNLQEGGRALRNYAESLESDPATMESAAGRLDALKRLMRKYGDSEESVIEHLTAAKNELADLTGDDSDEEGLAERLAALEAELTESASVLSDLRRARAKEFESMVTGHARELAMENAVFKVEVTSKPIDRSGGDLVTFVFSANKGEDLRPLSKVASGGEISRLMLAIKVSGAGRAGVPTLIFDEVDTGLSGRAAAVTAKTLEELSKHYQVVVISHLPQIAARATTHFRIEKVTEGGRTVTSVARLEEEERIREIARMLAGESIGESALANAREMVHG